MWAAFPIWMIVLAGNYVRRHGWRSPAIIRISLAAVLMLSVLLAQAAPTSKDVDIIVTHTTAVYPLGDSLTLGAYDASDFGIGGYRAPLWSQLIQEGYALDFVGSVNGPAPAGVDPNHEGHGGWRVDDLTNQIDGWLGGYKPDVILLLAGANDLIQGYGVDTATTRMDALLGRIFADRPNAVVLLGTLSWVPTPNFYNYSINQIQAYNNRLPALVTKYKQQGKAIELVDQYNLGLTAADFNADQVHPKASGYAKIAQAWHDPLANQLTRH
jgi:lysophospholipase L1-like esterase